MLFRSTNTELYQNAVTLTGLDGTTVSMKEVEKGHVVILKSGITARYMGKYHLLKKAWTDDTWFDLHAPQHLLLTLDKKQPKLLTYSNPKISKIHSKDILSDKDAEQAVNEHLANGGQTDGWWPMFGAFAKKPIAWSITIQPVDDIDAKLKSSNQSKTLLVELDDKLYGIFNPFYSRHPEYHMDSINIENLDQGQMSWNSEIGRAHV